MLPGLLFPAPGVLLLPMLPCLGLVFIPPLLRFPLFIILPPSLWFGPIGPDLEGNGGPPGPPLIIMGPPRIGGIPRIMPRIGPGGPPRIKGPPRPLIIIALMVGLGPRMPGIPLMPLILIIPLCI